VLRVLHSVDEVEYQTHSKDSVFHQVARSDQDVARMNDRTNDEDLTQDEEHEGKNDVRDHHRVASEFQVVPHTYHEKQEDHWYRDDPKQRRQRVLIKIYRGGPKILLIVSVQTLGIYIIEIERPHYAREDHENNIEKILGSLSVIE